MNGRSAVCTVVLAFLVSFPVAAKEKDSVSAGPFGGALFLTLLNDPSAIFRVEDLDRKAYAALPDTLKTRLKSYAERYAAFRTRLAPPVTVAGLAPTPSAKALYEDRQSMERAIAALSDSADAGGFAAAYAARAVLFHNWEHKSAHILAEAISAEKDIEDPALRPYLLLFLMHRYRCAYEYSVVGEDLHQAELISEKYQVVLKLAREYPDPLVRLMADDLDRYEKNFEVPSNFTKGVAHP